MPISFKAAEQRPSIAVPRRVQGPFFQWGIALPVSKDPKTEGWKVGLTARLATSAITLWQLGNRWATNSNDFLFLPPETLAERRLRQGQCPNCGHSRCGIVADGRCADCGAAAPKIQPLPERPPGYKPFADLWVAIKWILTIFVLWPSARP